MNFIVLILIAMYLIDLGIFFFQIFMTVQNNKMSVFNNKIFRNCPPLVLNPNVDMYINLFLKKIFLHKAHYSQKSQINKKKKKIIVTLSAFCEDFSFSSPF